MVEVNGRASISALICNDIHVTYRILGAKKHQNKNDDSLMGKVFNKLRGTLSATETVHAVKGVSFETHEGESIAIVGVNGSGKSSLLRAAAGLITPASGEVWSKATPTLLGVNAALIPSVSGARNIQIGGLALGMSLKEIDEKFNEIVDFADLHNFIHLPMSTYSSGMAARLRFAISTIANPEIIMIDEALATGDAVFKKRSKERMKELRENAGLSFLVSHDVDTVRSMTERTLWMHEGELVADGPTVKVIEEYEKFTKEYQKYKKSLGYARKKATLKQK